MEPNLGLPPLRVRTQAAQAQLPEAKPWRGDDLHMSEAGVSQLVEG